MDVRVLTYEDTERLLSPADCVAAIQSVYAEEAKGLTVNRPRSHSFLRYDAGEGGPNWYCFKTMEGGVKATGYFALRVSSMLMNYHSVKGRMRTGFTPSILTNGGEKHWLEMVMLFCIESGALVALMPGGYIQKMRVGCTTALGTKYMARQNSKVFGLIGSGWQASAQLLAHKELFRIERVRVYSITQAHCEQFCIEMTSRLGLPVEPVTSAEDAVRGSDVLICATGSHVPVFKGEWLEPGTHWSFIRCAEAGKDAFDRSDRIAVHSHTVARNAWARGEDAPPPGDEEFVIDVQQYPELCDLMVGHAPGREREHEITCFVTTQGLGIQFVALASLAHERATERNIGRLENWDHLLQNVHP